jgi:pyrroloquinoline-quinone synthase
MDFWERLDGVATRWDVLAHPFYQRWSAGELSAAELSLYAGQYAHAVRALAAASRDAADGAPGELAAELDEHAAEEEAHIAVWEGFSKAVDADPNAAPLPETAACVEAWAEPHRNPLQTLVALYAIEAAQPAIAQTKRRGLTQHYGFGANSAATAYFDVHVERDLVHAASGRRWIAERLVESDSDACLAVAEGVLEANWRLLDGVERAACAA